MNAHSSISLVFAIICVSCHSTINHRLDMAENFLQNQPDSSLAILMSINKENLRNDRLKARHALLSSIALDKNYIDIADDSIISKAVSFYSLKGNSEEKMKSWYYQGLVRKNAGDYTAAIVSLEMAEREATRIKESHLLGLIYRNKAAIYEATNNIVESIENTRKSIDAFESNGDTLYATYGKYSLAVTLLNNGENDASIKQLEQLIPLNLNSSLRRRCELCYARNLVEKGDSLEKAINTFKQIPETYYHVLDYGLYAVALYDTGQKDSALFWLNKGYDAFDNKDMTASLEHLHSQIAFKARNYELAYRLENNALLVQDSLTRALLQQSLNAAQRDYYRAQALIQEGVVKRQRTGIISGSSIALLTLAIFMLLGWQKKQRADTIVKEQMARLSLLQDNIIQSNALLVGALVKEKMERLYHLSEDYFKEDNPDEKNNSFVEFKNALREIRKNKAFFLSLETDLNYYCNDIFEKLLQQMPEINGENRRLAVLFFSGIPGEWIQVLCEKYSSGSVRTARSRLRSIIKEKHPVDERLFLEMLETKKQPRGNIK